MFSVFVRVSISDAAKNTDEAGEAFALAFLVAFGAAGMMIASGITALADLIAIILSAVGIKRASRRKGRTVFRSMLIVNILIVLLALITFATLWLPNL